MNRVSIVCSTKIKNGRGKVFEERTGPYREKLTRYSRNIQKVLVSLSLFVLVACVSSKEEKEVKQSSSTSIVAFSTRTRSQVEETSPSSHFTQETPKSASAFTKASFNGSYYSVQGKYGEIIIVNKKHPLSSDYVPGEVPEAVSAFHEIVTKMQSLGYAVSTTNYSGFRSYETQADLYQSYVAKDGKDNADRYSARAGYSEHQTGLAYDVLDSSGALLTEPGATQWLAENAHSYGFIVRYLPGKEDSTGYMPESWHIRYIGEEASDIYQSGQTLEEYFDLPGGGYED
ncbi:MULTISPECIES: LD-carboxypeptidase LdcB/DacB [unclassified Streptococcus]|uniref:LD-carboxypeptidase LdcB/DacB n=1 Tax=unclassified Streptococcus TaxID=2608887 RepID=UPI001071D90A|nr:MULTISPECIES: LD-carboxypeptidase LdcB/DacB [unclassified Streptococcus]MBF0786884.1 M15 family metallopeptidase [Streptococcus sp. 19428wC2_LYSM12]MCQ9212705.1 M15 family metallopeptidase [Streptococcus sp. B01]MCQ9214046.1 M15 family metallopeptidase [Streptococcus sp. O1]TFV06253.1 D-alanyl-D-alanine carboxypeptidase family protein [Streptococcus sp. LYSM12]